MLKGGFSRDFTHIFVYFHSHFNDFDQVDNFIMLMSNVDNLWQRGIFNMSVRVTLAVDIKSESMNNFTIF